MACSPAVGFTRLMKLGSRASLPVTALAAALVCLGAFRQKL